MESENIQCFMYTLNSYCKLRPCCVYIRLEAFMVKRFTELLLGYQLHPEVAKNLHFRDLPCARRQGHSDWKGVEKDQTATGRRFLMGKGAFMQSQDIIHNREWGCPVWQPCWFTSKALECDDFIDGVIHISEWLLLTESSLVMG